MDVAAATLAGRHALVTGAGRGIGWAVARALARCGARVTLLGRDDGLLSERQSALRDQYETETETAVADVTDAAQIGDAFRAAADWGGAIDILINNAGGAESAPFEATSQDLWADMLALNLTSVFLCSRAVIGGMRTAGFGRIVSIASTAGLKGYAYVSAYCAAKHGVVGLTRCLAAEFAAEPITVNAVCPGFADTDMTARAIDTIVRQTGRDRDQALNDLERFNPQRRLIRPEEVAEAVLWLCAPSSGAVTGQAIAIAGGEVT
jgi:NAD(P)-dependent dehydrogenase (short-subunit alcohol dehydrogenase family)